MTPIRPALAVLAATTAAALAGCFVVPVDPRTGQPYPIAPRDAMGAPSAATVVPTAPPSSVLTARLYPLNPQAQLGGLLTAVVVDTQDGRGRFTLVYLGDTLQGEATRVEASYAAFGRIHAEALGTAARGYTGRRGIANAVGTRGVGVQCEYQITGPSMGTGACVFSDGAKYQMHFGA